MNYCNLENLLVQLESKYRGSLSSPTGNAAHAVLSRKNNEQYFALDSLTQPVDLPVVVTLGANYTQGATARLPKLHMCISSGQSPFVSDRLTSERRRLVKCLDHFNSHGQEWFDNGLAASPTIPMPPKQGEGNLSFHMAMTNFCGWITQKKWSVLNENFGRMVTLKLLFENSGTFQHLDALVKALSGNHPILWVAHGLDSEVPSLARCFFLKHGIKNWIIAPNLGSWREIIRMNSINGLQVIKFGGK